MFPNADIGVACMVVDSESGTGGGADCDDDEGGIIVAFGGALRVAFAWSLAISWKSCILEISPLLSCCMSPETAELCGDGGVSMGMSCACHGGRRARCKKQEAASAAS